MLGVGIAPLQIFSHAFRAKYINCNTNFETNSALCGLMVCEVDLQTIVIESLILSGCPIFLNR